MNDHARQRVLVTGAGGFIGHHLVTDLKQRGFWVRGVDRKRPEFTPVDADEFQVRDLRRWDERLAATTGIDHVYDLAADMGGMGFISANHATILRNNALINLNIIAAARLRGGVAPLPQLLGLRLPGLPADRRGRHPAQGGRRLPGRPAGRLRLGEAPRGRNSDDTRIRQVLDWEPRTSLHDGLAETYRWIHKQVSG